jgi:hypothetical protein
VSIFIKTDKVSLSRRTVAALARVLSSAEIHLGTLFFEFGIESRDLGWGGDPNDRALAFVRGIEECFNPDEAKSVFLEIATRMFQTEPTRVEALSRSLTIEGFEYRDSRLIPVTPGAVNVANEISALESELQGRGFSTAVTHYRQAVDNFVDGNWEASNGQIRSCIEDLFVSAAVSGGLTTDEPRAALDFLRRDGRIDPKQWNLFRSYWDDIQDNGPHRGLSDPEEAVFRIHMGTALARYLLSSLRG